MKFIILMIYSFKMAKLSIYILIKKFEIVDQKSNCEFYSYIYDLIFRMIKMSSKLQAIKQSDIIITNVSMINDDIEFSQYSSSLLDSKDVDV